MKTVEELADEVVLEMRPEYRDLAFKHALHEFSRRLLKRVEEGRKGPASQFARMAHNAPTGEVNPILKGVK